MADGFSARHRDVDPHLEDDRDQPGAEPRGGRRAGSPPLPGRQAPPVSRPPAGWPRFTADRPPEPKPCSPAIAITGAKGTDAGFSSANDPSRMVADVWSGIPGSRPRWP